MTHRAESFDHAAYPWRKGIDYRAEPEAYRVSRGEQGVLICEPYKSEILPHWRFKTPEVAQISAEAIAALFERYLAENDFVGADMARKFLQMGFTRSRRYTNYHGGRKYDPADGHGLEKGTGDPQKAQSAAIFFAAWKQAEADPRYAERKAAWKKAYG